jgi:hypothetical protein
MTPREKAEELVNKMYEVDAFDDYNEISMQYSHAKQCAFIAINELMKAPHDTNPYSSLISSDAEDTSWFWDKFDEYWNDVKDEIEKL